MSTKRVTLADLPRVLKQDLRELHRRTVQATRPAAAAGREVARANAPVKTGRLRDGIIDEPLPDGARIRSTAPYSGKVEHGDRDTRPHPFMAPTVPEVEKLFQGFLEAAFDEDL